VHTKSDGSLTLSMAARGITNTFMIFIYLHTIVIMINICNLIILLLLILLFLIKLQK